MPPAVRVPDVDPATVVISGAPAAARGQCRWTPTKQASPVLRPPSRAVPCRPRPSATSQREQATRVSRLHHRGEPPTSPIRGVWGCERLGPALHSVVFERSAADSGAVLMTELVRRSDGDFDLTQIHYLHYVHGRTSAATADVWERHSAGRLASTTGVVPATVVLGAINTLRDVLATSYYAEPPVRPVDAGTGAEQVAFVLRAPDGTGIRHDFAGHRGDVDRSGRLLSIVGAATLMQEFLADAAVTTRVETVARSADAVRSLFAQRVRAAARRGDSFGVEYLPERLVGMVSRVGDSRHVPLVLSLLQPRRTPARAGTRLAAVNAIAVLTGYDARYDGIGAARDAGDAIADVLAACRS
ncbi:MAG: hypothetical protein AAF721_08445 [Myxococcota bacterium]